MSDFNKIKPPGCNVVSIETRRKGRKGKPDFLEAEKRKLEAERLFLLALEAEEEGNYDVAMNLCEKALEFNPNNIEPLLTLGAIFFDRGELQKAKECFEKASRIDPQNASAWFDLGAICDQLNQVKEAIECYQKAIKYNPQDADAHFNLALLLECKNEYFPAIHHYEEYLKFSDDPEDEQNRKMAQNTMEKLKQNCTKK